MHFKLALFLLVPMAMGFPAAISIPVETLTVTNIIPAAVYDLKAWQAVVDEHLASKHFSPQDWTSKRRCHISLDLVNSITIAY